jgi:Methyltransferase FkbM domain
MLKPLHGDVAIDILKADIEGAEFEVIPLLIESGVLDKVKQIALEVHFNKDKLRDNLKVIKALEDRGFVRFAIRPNIFWPTEIHKLTDHFMYEIAWYNIKYKELNPII